MSALRSSCLSLVPAAARGTRSSSWDFWSKWSARRAWWRSWRAVREEAARFSFLRARSWREGIEGPDWGWGRRVEEWEVDGRAGPKVSSPSSSSSLSPFAGSVLVGRGGRGSFLSWADAWAFCRVAGSYHPSASSPRFLTNVSVDTLHSHNSYRYWVEVNGEV